MTNCCGGEAFSVKGSGGEGVPAAIVRSPMEISTPSGLRASTVNPISGSPMPKSTLYSNVLGAKGIPNRVDDWGPEWHHDWPVEKPTR